MRAAAKRPPARPRRRAPVQALITMATSAGVLIDAALQLSARADRMG